MRMRIWAIVAVLTVSFVSVEAVLGCSSNQSPVAILSASPSTVGVGVNTVLDGSSSYDPDGSITKCEWDWTNNGSYDYTEYPGDKKATHAYSSAGTYTAKLWVQDNEDATDTDTCTVTVQGVHNVTTDTWYTTIQAAINDANNNDEIEVYPKTYTENVDFNDTQITLRSTDPNDWDVVSATIIDGGGSGNTVTFDSNDANSVIKGFAITDGEYGVSCAVSATITQCIIYDCNSDGINCSAGSATISRNKIGDNGGAGVYSSSTTPPTVKNNWIYDNDKGMQFASASSAATVRNNTIVDNDSNGVYVSSGTAAAITNCILWNNSDELNGCSATHSCIKDINDASGTGNISSYAYFEDYDSNDFHLTWNSPCLERGDPNFTDAYEFDIDGDSRVVDSRVDMGADELFDNEIHNSINLVQNPGFEDGESGGFPVHWSATAYSESLDANECHSGSYSWKLSNDANGSHDVGAVSEYIAAKPGELYKISAWVKAEQGTEAIIFGCDEHDASEPWKVFLRNDLIAIGVQCNDWINVTNGIMVTEPNASYIRVKLLGPYFNAGAVWWDDISLVKIGPEFLPPYGIANEANSVETIDFGGAETNIGWVSDMNPLSGKASDSNDGNITYRELKDANTLVLKFPAFNLDGGYDPNDPNDPNSLPLTPMLLEIMYKDTVNDSTNAESTSVSNLVLVRSMIPPINLDPNYLKGSSSSDWPYDIAHLGGCMDNDWRYMQFAFQRSDYQLIRAIGGNFEIGIQNNTDATMPIDYVSLRKITQAEYETLVNRQREVRGFDEADLPVDAPSPPITYDDPNITVFVRDIMRPVYKHTKPATSEIIDDPNDANDVISGFSCWGEVEPLSFSIYSENGVNDLTVTVSNLTHSDGNNIDGNDISIEHVIYDETRLNCLAAPKAYAFLPDRLEEFASLSVDANTSERIWLKIQVPSSDANLAAGLYEGNVYVNQNTSTLATMPVEINVYNLILDAAKQTNAPHWCPFTKVYSSRSHPKTLLRRITMQPS